MGLDITAYSNLRAVGLHTDSGWCENDEHIATYAYASFPASFRGIEVLTTKQTSGGTTLLVGGCYAMTSSTESHSFGAGPYGSYNRWRADLARQFNPYGPGEGTGRIGDCSPPDPDGPFYELIWFADNEGCIGELAAAELLADFRQHAAAYAPDRDERYFRQEYANWTLAFELGAAGGLVSFH